MKFDANDRETLLRILRWRRDVRHFRTDPVAPAVIGRLRAVMDSAPSVGNARPWRVLRVEDPAIRALIRANFEACNDRAAQGYDGVQAREYRALKLAGLDRAPLQLAVFTETDPEAGHRLGRATMPETLRQSTAMAIHTLWLAARAENIGMGMVSILEPEVVERALSVPGNWEFAAWLCLGHAEFDDDTPLLHREGWQENSATEWERR